MTTVQDPMPIRNVAARQYADAASAGGLKSVSMYVERIVIAAHARSVGFVLNISGYRTGRQNARDTDYAGELPVGSSWHNATKHEAGVEQAPRNRASSFARKP